MAAKPTFVFLALFLFVYSTVGDSIAQSVTNKNHTAPQIQSPQIKTVATRLRGFGVPFKIDAANDAFIEVQLYVSRDAGKNWKFLGRQTTNQTEFPFQASEDGEYWFCLKTLNRDRQLIPPGDPLPELKIIVDTVKPVLDFRIGTDAAGRVICRWQANDKNLDPQSLAVLYQEIPTDGSTQEWHRVPVNFKAVGNRSIYSDQIAWWPETNTPALNVVLEVSDTAGNRVQVDRQIVVPQSAWRHRAESTAQVSDNNQRNDVASNWAQPDSAAGLNRSVNKAPIPNGGASRGPTSTGISESGHNAGPDVVCENGVCRVIPPAAVNAVPTQSRPWNQANTNRTTQLVGSKIEFASPPVPPGYVPVQSELGGPSAKRQLATSQRNFSGRPATTDSIPWPSESKQAGPQIQTTGSTTLGIDSSIAPKSQTTLRPLNVPDVPSNPSVTTIMNDQVIGQSSTRGVRNQFQSPNSQGSCGIGQTNLLPAVPAHGNSSQATKRTTIPSDFKNQTADDPSLPTGSRAARSPIRQPSSPFSNAGHPTPRGDQLQSVLKPSITRRATNAPTQVLGSKRFRLDYGIDSIDPSGVAQVELWMTQDQGRSWHAWGSDPDHQSPMPVAVEEEGHYGFRIVVHSKDGLTGQGPSSGDDADIWIQVDTQSPLARITSVPYGRGTEAGQLVINYSVSDQFLALRPITFAFAPSPEGPWTIIEEGVRNDSRFVWKVGTQIPKLLFLRIDAIDQAGNVGVHVLNQPIDVSGLVPHGTIHGVVPVGQRPPGKN